MKRLNNELEKKLSTIDTNKYIYWDDNEKDYYYNTTIYIENRNMIGNCFKYVRRHHIKLEINDLDKYIKIIKNRNIIDKLIALGYVCTKWEGVF